MSKQNLITIIGGGLAGCEAAWAAANLGCQVRLFEMRPKQKTEAHQSGGLAELVCSNSLKSTDPVSASAVLREEMRSMGSLIVPAAEACAVPAGASLSVDRDLFSDFISQKIRQHPNINVIEERADKVPSEGICIIATGPLTAPELAADLGRILGHEQLFFFDAIAPIVAAESIDMNKVFAQSRYDKGEADYLNCPFNKEQYETFIRELGAAEMHQPHDFEKGKLFDGCQPVEEILARGPETLRFGPMKPVGLCDPRTGHMPWAALQLRKENAAGSLYNLVGFQTRMKWGEQARILKLVPGLENAEIVRYGSMHRNTFVNAPISLERGFQVKLRPGLFLAGQITGVEGYVESSASGILAGINAVRVAAGQAPAAPPRNTVLGSLIHYQAETKPKYYQPINAVWGLVEPLPKKRGEGKKERYARYALRAKTDFEAWKKGIQQLVPEISAI